MQNKTIIKKNIIITILTIFLILSIGLNIILTIESKSMFVYNGIEYQGDNAYINLYLENSESSLTFSNTNFSIRNDNSNTVTPDSISYRKVDYNYWNEEININVNRLEKVYIRLKINKNLIKENSVLYYNNQKVSKL